MPVKIYFDDKICLNCDNSFNRSIRKNGRMEGADEFRERKFCCHKCFSNYNTGTNHVNYIDGIKHGGHKYLRYSNDTYIHRVVMEKYFRT